MAQVPAVSIEFRRARVALAFECRNAQARGIGQPRICQLLVALSFARHLRAVYDHGRLPLRAFAAIDMALRRSYAVDCRRQPSADIHHTASGTRRPFAASADVGNCADALGAAGDRSELCEFGAGAVGVCPELCRAIDSEMEPPGCGVRLNRRAKFADYRR